MYLVSGTSSGLGKYLHEELGAVSYCRKQQSTGCKDSVDVIIHCAFNASQKIDTGGLSDYVNDNLLLTQRLLAIPHKKFIFISSSDVYPKDQQVWKEDDVYLMEKVEGLYGACKLMVEALIKNQATNYLILRPTALLGKYSRPNSLMKILNNQDVVLTLSANYKFNYILHEDVLAFIQKAISNDINGVFNLAANESIQLGAVAKMVAKDISFGSYTYTVGDLCNNKAKSVCDIFANTSRENIKRFQLAMEAVHVKESI